MTSKQDKITKQKINSVA